MKFKFKIAINILICFLIASSCKKEVSRTELLTSGSWQLIALQTDFFGVPADSYADMEDCEKDNLFTFKTDNTIDLDEGPTKCDPNDPQTRNEGPWTLFDNDTKINMDSIDFDILELTESHFKINGTTLALGLVVNVELTFGK